MEKRVFLAKDEIYHVLNRGVEKRITFTDRKEYLRARQTLDYYQYANPPLRLSHFIKLENDTKLLLSAKVKKLHKQVEILAYCLMPNHFHFLLRQTTDNGISKFIANFTNSYTKYFNTKHDRVGPLFQGLFKAVHIENDEQLLHTSRYIHINPSSSFLVSKNSLSEYPWSSYPEYLKPSHESLCETNTILQFFPSRKLYEQFVLDQVDYAQNLERMKHLLLE
jgi:putative transposase